MHRLYLAFLTILLIPAQSFGLGIDIEGFSEEQKKTIMRAAVEWDDQFSCGKIVIRPMEKIVEQKYSTTVATVEVASPGRIDIFPEEDAAELRNTVIHSMTHACQNGTRTTLPDPIPFSDGKILGYAGANILVRLNSGRETKFTLLEEAIAERNSSMLPGYSVSHPGYFAVGKLAIKHFSVAPNLMKLVQNNDVPALVCIILGKPKEMFRPQDILAIMRLFQDTWDNGVRNPNNP